MFTPQRTLCLLIPFFGILFAASCNSPKVAAYGTVPTFEFTDVNGKPVSNESIRGNLTLVHLFFTSCRHICPMVVSNIKSVLKEVPDVTVLSLTVDLNNDTVATLQDYARQRDLPESWHLIRPAPEELERFAQQGLKLGLQPVASDHTTRIVLIDGAGTIRGYYKGDETETPGKIVSDIRALSKE